MNEKSLILAKEIFINHYDKKLTISTIAKQRYMTRPHVLNYLALYKLPNKLKKYYLSGAISFIPLIQIHREFGESSINAISLAIEKKNKSCGTRLKKVTLKDVKSLFENKATDFIEKPILESKSKNIDYDQHTVNQLSDILDILDSANISRKEPECLIISKSHAYLIKNTIKSLLNISLVTTTASQISLGNDYAFDQSPLYQAEDENQDFYPELGDYPSYEPTINH